MELSDLRKEIDQIDQDLVALFCKRMGLSAQISLYKKEHQMPIYVPSREQEILAEVGKMAGDDLANYTKELYSLIFQLSRDYQSKNMLKNSSTMHYGLLGKKLGHSYSPQIHSHLGNYPYALFEKQEEELADFLQSDSFQGLNVTIPYKKAVIPFCAELSEAAQKLGAVNTIVRRADGTLIGHNTDYYGFQSMVTRSGLQPKGKKCLVLGSGGASNTAVAVLKELGAEVVVISRNGENNYQNISKHHDAYLIVNATPVGMYPDNGVTPLPLDEFFNLKGVLDLVYNPARTQLLLDAQALGITAMNGLWMLVAQAKESAEWFTGKSIDDGRIQDIYDILKEQMENIVLVGMPGCGKSTIGKAIAAKTGRKFADSDELIVQLASKSIPAIFEEDGEEVFRQRETQALAQLGKQSNMVIATGGGCVTRSRNYPLLHQNGRIIWLKRDLSLLAIDGRPLSQQTKLEEMAQVREPLYRQFADCILDNDDTIDKIVARILEHPEEIP